MTGTTGDLTKGSDLKICIYGAGVIGGHMGVMLQDLEKGHPLEI